MNIFFFNGFNEINDKDKILGPYLRVFTKNLYE